LGKGTPPFSLFFHTPFIPNTLFQQTSIKGSDELDVNLELFSQILGEKIFCFFLVPPLIDDFFSLLPFNFAFLSFLAFFPLLFPHPLF